MYNKIPLLYSDIPTKRYNVTDLEIITYLKNAEDITYSNRRLVKQIHYNSINMCKTSLYDYSEFSSEQLAQLPLPDKEMDSPYTPNLRLKINTDNILSFNPTIASSFYQNSINKYHICFNEEETKRRYDTNKERMKYINKTLCKFFNVELINWSGRKYTYNHYGNLLVEKSNGAIPKYKHYNANTGNITMKTSDLEYYLNTLPNLEEYNLLRSVLRGMIEYKKLRRAGS